MVPPFTGVALKVTLAPLQMDVPSEEAMVNEGTTLAFAAVTVMFFVTVHGIPSDTSTTYVPGGIFVREPPVELL